MCARINHLGHRYDVRRYVPESYAYLPTGYSCKPTSATERLQEQQPLARASGRCHRAGPAGNASASSHSIISKANAEKPSSDRESRCRALQPKACFCMHLDSGSAAAPRLMPAIPCWPASALAWQLGTPGAHMPPLMHMALQAVAPHPFGRYGDTTPPLQHWLTHNLSQW